MFADRSWVSELTLFCARAESETLTFPCWWLTRADAARAIAAVVVGGEALSSSHSLNLARHSFWSRLMGEYCLFSWSFSKGFLSLSFSLLLPKDQNFLSPLSLGQTFLSLWSLLPSDHCLWSLSVQLDLSTVLSRLLGDPGSLWDIG